MTSDIHWIGFGSLALVSLVVGFAVFGGGNPSLPGAAVGLLIGIGGLLLVTAYRPDVIPKRIRDLEADAGNVSVDPLRVTGALIVAIVVMVVLGWPAAALAAGAAAYFLPTFFSNGAGYQEYAAKTEAIASWIEALRDKMASSRGLEGAIVSTARTAPHIIRPTLEELVVQIDHGVSIKQALVNTAEEMEHPIADMAVATMVMALNGDATRIADVLNELAKSSRESAASMVAIHAERASARTTVKMVIFLTVALLTVLFTLFREFLSFYASSSGQLLLLAGFAMIGGALVWIARLSTPPRPARMIRPDGMV